MNLASCRNRTASCLAAGLLAVALLTAAPRAGAQGGQGPVVSETPLPAESRPKDVLTRAKAHTELGALYFNDGNLIVALEELSLAIAINPEYAPAYSTRGLVLYYAKELPSAEKDFRRAMELAGRDPEINNNFGWFLCQTGREKEGLSYFDRALANSLYRTPELAMINAGTCQIKLNNLDAAEDHLRRALRLAPNSPAALFQVARIAYLRGNDDAARMYLKKVFDLVDANAEVLWLALRVERRLGDAQAQNSYAAQLRRRFPDSPEYNQLLKGNFE